MNNESSAIVVNFGKLKPNKALVVGVPQDARLSAGRRLDDGIWELAPGELNGLRLTRSGASDADIDLAVHLVGSEILHGSVVESVDIRHIRVEVEAALDFISGGSSANADNSLSFV